jgi:hypothetical protein
MSAVVGIFTNTDTVGALAHAMKLAGFDVADLTVISNQEPTGYLVSVGANYVAHTDPTRISGDVEISVPGSGSPRISDLEAPESSPALESLSDLAVPDGRTDDYMSAVEAGRCVAGIETDKVDQVKALFVAAGGNPVGVF